MPSSSPRGKNWISDQIKRITARSDIKSVLDVGTGEGTYLKKFKSLTPNAQWNGIEIWQPYVEKYKLIDLYDRLVNQDARSVDYSQFNSVDLAFAGDVLEHMTKDESISLVDQILKQSKCLFISIPIIHMPQGEYDGNPYEKHIKDDWSDSEVRETFSADLINYSVDNEIGVYLLSRDTEFIANYRKLKVAIYTICKNEEKFVEKWLSSNQEADYRLVCDTGSTDNTVDLLKVADVNVVSIKVLPWRFDVARGTALNLLPIDIDVCIWQDFDEELLPGWRQALESNWNPGTTTANHRYRNNDGNWQWHSKIHARHNCHWIGAVHETLQWSIPEQISWIPELYLDEHQDTTKSRKSYLHLLEKKVSEGDKNWRTYAFLAGEYQGAGLLDKGIEFRIKSYEACDDGEVVKSYAARHIAQCYWDLGKADLAERWFKIATDHGTEREAWFKLSEFYYNTKRWEECFISAKKCLNTQVKRDGFTFDGRAWGLVPYDFAALAAYYIGLYPAAVEFGEKALTFAPDDQRLQDNLKFYKEKVQ